MERLTTRNIAGVAVYKHPFECEQYGDTIWRLPDYGNGSPTEKLADYEDAEEHGLLLRLPCKVGDTVYCIFTRYTKCTPDSTAFDEYSCQGCEYECDSKKEKYIQDMRAYSLDWIVTNLKNFGKTVFLTKEEAEATCKNFNKEHQVDLYLEEYTRASIKENINDGF